MTKIDKKLQEINERMRFVTDYKHIGMMDKMKIDFLTELIDSAEKLKKIYRKGDNEMTPVEASYLLELVVNSYSNEARPYDAEMHGESMLSFEKIIYPVMFARVKDGRMTDREFQELNTSMQRSSLIRTMPNKHTSDRIEMQNFVDAMRMLDTSDLEILAELKRIKNG